LVVETAWSGRGAGVVMLIPKGVPIKGELWLIGVSGRIVDVQVIVVSFTWLNSQDQLTRVVVGWGDLV
jgi:hypothetical protein